MNLVRHSSQSSLSSHTDEIELVYPIGALRCDQVDADAHRGAMAEADPVDDRGIAIARRHVENTLAVEMDRAAARVRCRLREVLRMITGRR